MVTTAGSLNAAAVAEYTFGLLLTLVRKVREADRLMRAGGWDRRPLTGVELEGRTLGIVGVGAIGGRVARQGLAFGMQVIGCDPAYSEPPVPGMRLGSLEEVLAAADILTLHPRLNPTTFRMIDAVALAALHPGAIVVNTSRGEVVDEGALTASLQAGHLAGAALDVFADEPLAPESPLREMENVVLSPHVAGQTQEAMVQVAHSAAQAILDDLAGRRAGVRLQPRGVPGAGRKGPVPGARPADPVTRVPDGRCGTVERVAASRLVSPGEQIS